MSKYNNNNEALRWAKILSNKIPVIYGSSSTTEIVALRFKGQLQENSKMIAFHNLLPEMNHNEIEGWYDNENLIVIWLKDKDDISQIEKRISITKKILENSNIVNKILEVSGENFTERFLKFIILTDWISYYLAILNKIDPSPVEKIQKIKRAIKMKLVKVNKISYYSPAKAYKVLLIEEKSSNEFCVIVGTMEAQSIAMAIEKIKLPRPMTHDLIYNILENLIVKSTKSK